MDVYNGKIGKSDANNQLDNHPITESNWRLAVYVCMCEHYAI